MHNDINNQNATVEETTTEVMGRSLLQHAKEIYRYAVSYCSPSDANQRLAQYVRDSFIRNLKRMITDMDRLMDLARDKGVDRYANVEMIDAYVFSAREIIQKHYPIVEVNSIQN